jgi:hypothetical protein
MGGGGARPAGARPFVQQQFAPRSFAHRPFAAQGFAHRPFAPQGFAHQPFASQGFAHRPFGAKPFVTKPFGARPFVHRPFYRPFGFYGVAGSSVFVYGSVPGYAYYPAYYPTYYPTYYPAYYPPSYSDPAPVYYDAPAYYPPASAGTVTVAPAAPPSPSVIQYPRGRYELRGDGTTTPYVWVWVPNPPAAPPAPVEPPSEPGAPPESAPGNPPAAPQSQIYRWTDAEGVQHWTNTRRAVPEQYRLQEQNPLQMKSPRPG